MFDGDGVRRILQRAAEEQLRIDNELADAYSLEELQEMAAEVRISPEALSAAIAADARHARVADGGAGATTLVKRAVLMTAGFVALSSLLLALALTAPVLFWGTLVSLLALSTMILADASPF
jgi:hypothetical protein